MITYSKQTIWLDCNVRFEGNSDAVIHFESKMLKSSQQRVDCPLGTFQNLSMTPEIHIQDTLLA